MSTCRVYGVHSHHSRLQRQLSLRNSRICDLPRLFVDQKAHQQHKRTKAPQTNHDQNHIKLTMETLQYARAACGTTGRLQSADAGLDAMVHQTDPWQSLIDLSSADARCPTARGRNGPKPDPPARRTRLSAADHNTYGGCCPEVACHIVAT